MRIVTLTVTEAGYVRGTDGGLNTGLPDVRSDLAALRSGIRGIGATTPARLVAGLAPGGPPQAGAAGRRVL